MLNVKKFQEYPNQLISLNVSFVACTSVICDPVICLIKFIIALSITVKETF